MPEGRKASYRMHARRWGVARIARKMMRDGYPIDLALEVLVGEAAMVRYYDSLLDFTA